MPQEKENTQSEKKRRQRGRDQRAKQMKPRNNMQRGQKEQNGR